MAVAILTFVGFTLIQAPARRLAISAAALIVWDRRSRQLGTRRDSPGGGRLLPPVRTVVPAAHMVAALDPAPGHFGPESMRPQNDAFIELVHRLRPAFERVPRRKLGQWCVGDRGLRASAPAQAVEETISLAARLARR